MPDDHRTTPIPRLVLGELLFWLHLGLIVCLILSGLFLPLAAVILILIAHRVHVILLDGCVLTEIKKKIGVMPTDMTFLQHVSARFFKKPISRRQSTLLDYSFGASALFLAILKFALIK